MSSKPPKLGVEPTPDDATTPLTLKDFKLMSIEHLRVYLFLRKKSNEGDFDTLAARALVASEENIHVDEKLEEQMISNLKEYKEKLIAKETVLPDPVTLKQNEWTGEENGGLKNWPSIYYHDIANYLASKDKPGEFLHRLDCHYKEGKGYRYFDCGWVKEIFWHGISDNSNFCFIKSRVTPSQRTSSTAYKVWAAVHKSDPGGEIVSAYCSCIAGMLGTCNHVAAMLFRIEAAVTSGLTKPTCTGIPCPWLVPKGVKPNLEMKPIKDTTFYTATYSKNGHKEEREKNLQALNNYSPYQYEIESPEIMRKKIYEAFAQSNRYSRFVELMEYTKKNRGVEPEIQPCIDDCNIPDGILIKAKKFSYNENENLEKNVEDFTKSIELKNDEITLIYNLTRQQAKSEVWKDQRKGRISASKFYNVYTRMNTMKSKPHETPDVLIKDLIERPSIRGKKAETALKHGINLETTARNQLKRILRRKGHKNLKFTDNPGMTIDKDYPYISVSPDGEGGCACCGTFIIEIKCPHSVCETVPTSKNLAYLKEITNEDGEKKTILHKTHIYYAQVQGQMAVTGRDKAWFFVYTKHGHHLELIELDRDYWCDKILENLIFCWKNYLAPTLLGKQRLTLNLANSDPSTSSNQKTKKSQVSTNSKGVNVANKNVLNASTKTKPKTKRKRKQTSSKSSAKKPAVYLCAKCKKDCVSQPDKLESGSVYCEKCKVWLHFGCIGILTEDAIPPRNKKFYCGCK